MGTRAFIHLYITVPLEYGDGYWERFSEIFAVGLLVVVGLLMWSAYNSRNFLNRISYRLISTGLPFQKVPAQTARILQAHHHFYRKLSERGKRQFIRDIQYLQKRIEFRTTKDYHVTEEQRILILASAAQLTFKIGVYHYESLKAIIVYPGAFYSQLAEDHVQGLTVNNQYVYLSWEHVQSGFADPADRINLALHEFSHIISSLYYVKGDYIGLEMLEELELYFARMDDSINEGKYHSIRKYGAGSFMEFFSVATEAFFESPILFRQELPHIYDMMKKIYRMDPLNEDGDFGV